MPTTKLILPTISGNMTADVVRDFNALAEAVDGKAGTSNGLATLDSSGKVPANQLNIDTSNLATKEELTAHKADDGIHVTQAKQDSWNQAVTDIGSKSSLKTTAKNDLVSAINEAFQFANDGKTDIASVVGSPATVNDTFALLKTHIQNVKNKGATNLTNKGQSANGNESLDSLMSKIANVNTGRNSRSGTVTTSGNTSNFTVPPGGTGSYVSNYSATVTGLPFNPSIVILVTNGWQNTLSKSSFTFFTKNLPALSSVIAVNNAFENNPHVSTIYTCGDGNKDYGNGALYARQGEFKMPFYQGNQSVIWIAIE